MGYGLPLYWAVQEGDVGIVKILLKYGANPQKIIKGKNYPSVLNYAENQGDSEIVNILKSK